VPEWLQQELAAGLAPVPAPDALQDRLFRPATAIPARRVSALLIAAAMMVLTAGTVWLSARQPVRSAPARWNPAIRAQLNDHSCALCHTL
jgi:hypothetical protein